MFKKFGMALVAACLLLPVQAKAESADQMGVYVTPKFVYGIMSGNKAKAYDTESGSSRSIGSLDDVAGGALAIGYDFSKRFDLPIRAELEYSIFGDTKASKGFCSVDPTDDDGIYHYSLKQKINI